VRRQAEASRGRYGVRHDPPCSAGDQVSETVRDFAIRVPQEQIDDLIRRLRSTRWPPTVCGVGWEEGTDVAWLRELCTYWIEEFDWRAQERYLNGFHHEVRHIDDLDVHFIHERGRGPDPIPLVLTHGWPSTFYEFHRLIRPLTDPAAFGGDARDSFDVVVPSLPGYGFSSPPTRRGVGTTHVADMWVRLMTDLGYDRFASHGGDWGSAVTAALGMHHPERLLALHFTMVSPPIDPDQLSGAHREWWDRLQTYRDQEWGYVHLQRTKPQTPAFGLTDSPAGLAAWILEKWWRWSDCADESGRRDLLRVYPPEDLLTTVAIYWFTGTIGPSMRLYRETFGPKSGFKWESRITVPTGFTAFRDPNAPPRELVEPWLNLQHYSTVDRGGHFPALENPDALVGELRTFFRAFR
jgi:pimeloyl-ACP methyl ester carboxylesterase